MANKVELKSAPPAPDTGADKLPEAVVQPPRGATAQVTVNTEQEPKKDEPKTERPAWLPKEFNTPEEFAAAYQKSVEDKAKGEKKPEEPKTDEKVTEQNAQEAIEKAGLDAEKLQQEFRETGTLSEESIAALEKAGYQRAQIEEYIEGQKARAQLVTQRLYEAVGGEENLKATLEWAEKALTAEEIAEANKILASGNEAQMKLVLTGLNTRRLSEVGVEPSLVGGRPGPRGGEVKGYASTQEWINDVNSQAYRTDPAFREKVMRRVAASDF